MSEVMNVGVMNVGQSVFPAGGPNRAVSAVFRAPGGRNGKITSCISPRRSDAAPESGAPRLPFSHIIVGSLQQKRDSGPFRGSPVSPSKTSDLSFGKVFGFLVNF